MKVEPAISHGEIQEILALGYQLSVKNMKFIPAGMCSWSYHVITKDNKEYFLKILPKNSITSFAEESLKTLHSLRTLYLIDQLPFPFPTNGEKYIVEKENLVFELFEFLNGKTDEQERFNDKEWYKVGELLAKIHSLTKNLQSFPHKETFETEFILQGEKLLNSVKNAKRNSSASNVFTLLNQASNALHKTLQEFKEITQRLQTQPNLARNFVFCHSDPTQGNVMKNTEGKIFLIDWDTPILAPREKDLVCIADNEAAMKGYRSIFPDVLLNEDINRFYSLCWTIDLILDHVPKDFNLENDIPQENYEHLKNNLIEYGLLR